MGRHGLTEEGEGGALLGIPCMGKGPRLSACYTDSPTLRFCESEYTRPIFALSFPFLSIRWLSVNRE